MVLNTYSKESAISKTNWETNYNNSNLSGIEFKDSSGKVVHFITIENNYETNLDYSTISRRTEQRRNVDNNNKRKPFRTSFELDSNGMPILPAKKTFEELIQEKRRQQAILYASATSSSGNATSNDNHDPNVMSANNLRRSTTLTHRRAINAVRRLAKASSRRARATVNNKQAAGSTRKRASTSRRRTTATRSRPRTGTASSRPNARNMASGQMLPIRQPIPHTSIPPAPVLVAQSSASQCSHNQSQMQAAPTLSPATPSQQAKTVSMKALNSSTLPLPIFGVDPRVVQALLKQAPAGATITLPNGHLVKKSKRGGARAGAGRKRSRPHA